MIDIVAWHAATRLLLVIELKTRLVNVSELMATMDVRQRVAWHLAAERGWRPAAVSIWVVVASSRTNMRVLADHRTVLRAKFPVDGRTVRRWVANPVGEVACLSFLPRVRVPDLGADLAGPRRVPRRGSAEPERVDEGHRRVAPRIGVTFRD